MTMELRGNSKSKIQNRGEVECVQTSGLGLLGRIATRTYSCGGIAGRRVGQAQRGPP
jgi:hypothetical protein